MGSGARCLGRRGVDGRLLKSSGDPPSQIAGAKASPGFPHNAFFAILVQPYGPIGNWSRCFAPGASVECGRDRYKARWWRTPVRGARDIAAAWHGARAGEALRGKPG